MDLLIIQIDTKQSQLKGHCGESMAKKKEITIQYKMCLYRGLNDYGTMKYSKTLRKTSKVDIKLGLRNMS